MNVVTRFPPSPTGFMHIGNAKTALYNWLFAKHHGGKFLVRIEDTDRKRYSEEAVTAILKGLEWLELDYDGEVVSQFSNQKRHREIAKQLVANGKAYYCYCSKEELKEMREKAISEGHNTFYDRRWRDRDSSKAPEGINPVIRIKAPLEGSTTIKDHVQGNITINNKTLDDFIILRSDGTPTYMLSVVVDDFDMGVTHIIRGDDHINNAFRQKIIFDAMQWPLPEFVHCSLIHGSDGGKFSKRHGATSVEEYKEMGYLPEAMRNYLLRLGWSHGNDEIISTDKAIEWFNLEGIGKSASRFDFKKLENLNSHYIKIKDSKELLELVRPFYNKRHNIELSKIAEERILANSEELQSRAKTLLQFCDESVFYAKSSPITYDEKANKLLDEKGKESLKALLNAFTSLTDFTAENIQNACKDIANNLHEGKLGKVAMPLRAAITGTTVSPSVFHASEILGFEETSARIQAAIEHNKIV